MVIVLGDFAISIFAFVKFELLDISNSDLGGISEKRTTDNDNKIFLLRGGGLVTRGE